MSIMAVKIILEKSEKSAKWLIIPLLESAGPILLIQLITAVVDAIKSNLSNETKKVEKAIKSI